MIQYRKNLFIKIVRDVVIAIILYGASAYLESDYIDTFIDGNLITLLLALLAINTTTISVILTKLHDISEEKSIDLSRSIKEMKNSIGEQVVILIVSVMALVLKTSKVILNLWPNVPFLMSVILIGLFIFAIEILYDTANGIFVIMHHENSMAREKVEVKKKD